MNKSENHQYRQAPHESPAEIDPFLFIPVHLDIKTESKQQGKDGIGFAADQQKNQPDYCAVGFGRKEKIYLWFPEKIKMLNTMDKDNQEECHAPQGVNNKNSFII